MSTPSGASVDNWLPETILISEKIFIYVYLWHLMKAECYGETDSVCRQNKSVTISLLMS